MGYAPSNAIAKSVPVKPRGPWQPILADGSVEEFLHSSRIESDGTVVLGGVQGGWARLFAVDPGQHLLRARVRMQGEPLVQGAAMAMVHVAQTTERVTVDDLRSGAVDEEVVSSEMLRAAGEFVDLEMPVEVQADTESLIVGVSLPPAMADKQVTGRFSDLRLVRAGFDQLLASEVVGGGEFDSREVLPTGAFRVGMVEREAMALAPGSEASFELACPESASHLEAMVAVVSGSDAVTHGRVRFVCDVLSAGEELLKREFKSIQAQTAAAGRWARLEVPVPSDALGAPLQIRFRTERLSGTELALPLVSAPRIVSTTSRQFPNLVLVSIDTLRSDHVGAYGYERDTTPRIDELAGEAVVFRDCWSQSAYTLPAHVSLFSGQLPSRHGVQRPRDPIDSSRTTLLAEILFDHGYSTAAFTGGGFLDPTFGFARGFGRFGVVDPVLNPESERVRAFMEAQELSVDAFEEFSAASVVEWIERHRSERFFVFFHTYAPHDFDAAGEYREALGLPGEGLSADPVSQQWLAHSQYRPQRPIRADEITRLVDHYDAAIRAADDAVGEILAALRRLDLWEETIVVVTSDHGKELGERGAVDHGHSLYEELLQVPLIIRIPGREAAVVEEPTMLVDVAPTVLAQMGLQPPLGIQGHDLFAPSSHRSLFAELDFGVRIDAFRDGPRKTIYRPGFDPTPDIEFWQLEHFDLGEDPAEAHPIALDPAVADEVRTLREQLQALGEAAGSEAGTSTELPAALRRRLESLGYDV